MSGPLSSEPSISHASSSDSFSVQLTNLVSEESILSEIKEKFDKLLFSLGDLFHDYAINYSINEDTNQSFSTKFENVPAGGSPDNCNLSGVDDEMSVERLRITSSSTVHEVADFKDKLDEFLDNVKQLDDLSTQLVYVIGNAKSSHK